MREFLHLLRQHPTAVRKFLTALAAFIVAVGASAVDGFTVEEGFGLAAAFILGPVLVFLLPNAPDDPSPHQQVHADTVTDHTGPVS